MKITLRKASALQNAINDTIKGIKLETQLQINEFQNAEAVIAAANNTLNKNLDRKIALTNALYAIRSAVGQANSAKVDSLLAQVANVEKNIQIYSELANVNVREDAVVLNGKLEKIKNRPADARPSFYGGGEEVSTSVVTESSLENYRRFILAAKKAKQKLQDEILEENVRTEIELGESVVSTLAAENLL